jgi:hypothetical protein
MSLFKSVLPPLVVVGTVCAALAHAPSAEAYELRSGTILGYQAEILDSGSYSDPDLIAIYGPYGREDIVVTCAPYDWGSSGPNTQSFVEQVTQEWCF